MLTGCVDCGSRAVGEPLARPERELPSYGRGLLIAAVGGTAFVVFIVTVVATLVKETPITFDAESIAVATRVAAWKLKWFGLPLMLVAVWFSWRVCLSIKSDKARFNCLNLAHAGFLVNLSVVLLIATLIGITVPTRLRSRQRGIDAAFYAQGYTIQSALIEYRLRYGTLPAEPKDLLKRLPDPDGSLAAALADLGTRNYKPTADIASIPKGKAPKTKGVALSRVSLDTGADDVIDEGVSFTNYELRLPGEDKVLGTEDDFLMRDGVIIPVSELEAPSALSTAESAVR